MRALPNAVLVLLLMSACGEPTPAPLTCADGGEPMADGGCQTLSGLQCPVGSRPTTAGGCSAVGWLGCPAGFVTDPAGGCAEVLPAADCGPNRMPVLGKTECQPVGWATACPAGFTAHPSGWGCIDLSPAASCGSGTRAALGQTSCVPLGDCATAFPPSAATLFVDDSYLAGQLDSTHFKTVQAALDAATAGATIAIEAGSYPESLVAARAVKLVGRCAEQVRVTGTFAVPGLKVTARDVAASGLTFEGQLPGARVEAGASLLLTSVQLLGNRRAGAEATGAGASLELRQSVVRSTSVDTASLGAGVLAGGAAQVSVDDSELSLNPTGAASVTGTGSVGHLSRSLLLGNAQAAMTASALASGKGSVELTECAVVGSKNWGLLANGTGSRASVTRSVLRDPVATGLAAVGVASQNGTIEVTSSALWDFETLGGLALDSGGQTFTDSIIAVSAGRTLAAGAVEAISGPAVNFTRSVALNMGRSGIISEGASHLTLTDSLMRGNREGIDYQGLFQAYSAAVFQGGTLKVEGSAFIGNVGPSVYVVGVGSTGTVSHSVVLNSQEGSRLVTPSSVQVSDGAGLTLTDSVISGGAGIGLALNVESGGPWQPVRVDMQRTVVRGNHAATTWPDTGALFAAQGSTVTVADSAFIHNDTAVIISDGTNTAVNISRVDIRDVRSVGAEFAYGVLAGGEGRVTLVSTTLSEVEGAGVMANTGATVTVLDSQIARLPAKQMARGVISGFGGAAVAGATFSASDSTFLDCESSALAWQDATGAVAGSLVQHSAVGVQVQGTSTLKQVGEVGTPAPLEVLVSSDTAFVDNAVTVGSGTVPLPSP